MKELKSCIRIHTKEQLDEFILNKSENEFMESLDSENIILECPSWFGKYQDGCNSGYGDCDHCVRNFYKEYQRKEKKV